MFEIILGILFIAIMVIGLCLIAITLGATLWFCRQLDKISKAINGQQDDDKN